MRLYINVDRDSWGTNLDHDVGLLGLGHGC